MTMRIKPFYKKIIYVIYIFLLMIHLSLPAAVLADTDGQIETGNTAIILEANNTVNQNSFSAVPEAAAEEIKEDGGENTEDEPGTEEEIADNNGGNGEGLEKSEEIESGCGEDTSLSNNNESGVTNNINGLRSTGDNSISSSTGNSEIYTGNITIDSYLNNDINDNESLVSCGNTCEETASSSPPKEILVNNKKIIAMSSFY